MILSKIIHNEKIILRKYNFESDPYLIVKYLYTAMQSEDGIKALIESDKDLWLHPVDKARFVAEASGDIISSLVLIRSENSREKHKFFMYSTVTAAHYQNRGIMTELFYFSLEWAKKKGAKLILVSTAKENLPAQNFFNKVGFKKYGTLPFGLYHPQKQIYESEKLYYYLI